MNLLASMAFLQLLFLFSDALSYRIRITRSRSTDRNDSGISQSSPVRRVKHSAPRIANSRRTFDSLRFTEVIVKPETQRNDSNAGPWEWVFKSTKNHRGRIIVPQNHGKLLESQALSNGMIDAMAVRYVKFYLFTKKNPIYPQVLAVDSLKLLRRSNFQANVTTVFLTHGWINSANVASVTSVRDAYLNGTEEVNVIVVNWSLFSASLYSWSEEKVKRVGIRIAQMIDFLQTSAQLRLNSTTLVGHSLGAHVMGVTGKKTNGTINQIFGLDPTRRHFLEADNKNRLSRRSARNVQVIHTNGKNQGSLRPLGHADFYPNGGSTQPGCSGPDFYTNGGCSHAQSFWFFAESLNSPIGFKAVRCKLGEKVLKGECSGRVELMGGRSNNINVVGRYYLETSNTSPYALNLQQKSNKP